MALRWTAEAPHRLARLPPAAATKRRRMALRKAQRLRPRQVRLSPALRALATPALAMRAPVWLALRPWVLVLRARALRARALPPPVLQLPPAAVVVWRERMGPALVPAPVHQTLACREG